MTDDWQQLAKELSEHGVPQRRAEVVALVSKGRTHSEVADELGLSDRSAVSVHLTRYRSQDLPNARWLVKNAPDV